MLLSVDLLTKEVWTLFGLKTAHVLFALHLATRRLVLAEATFAPTGVWMGQMARNLLMSCEDRQIIPRVIVHDRDALLTWDCDAVLKGAAVKTVKMHFRAPDANAHAERWVESVTGECLDHLILCGLRSLHRALRIYVAFFDEHRPHQGIANRVPGRPSTGTVPVGHAPMKPERGLRVQRHAFLGGLLNSYHREVA